jgi:hypothetical protein
MSAEDSAVRLTTEEPHQSPPHDSTQNTTTTPITTTLPTPSYTHLPLPPVHKKSIRIMFNNTNAIQTESPMALANTMQQYITHDPTVLGLIETRYNWQLADKTSIPLHNMATSLQGNGKAKTKLATTNYQEAHTANDICQPGGVAQLTMNKILNLVKHSGSDSLGQWVWQEYRVNGTYSLYIITAY